MSAPPATLEWLRSRVGERGAWSAEGIRARAGSMALRRTFRDVERFCFFIGYPRSGHSLIGELLNAHPEMVIANELNLLKYLGKGLSRAQLFTLLFRRDAEFGATGRSSAGYSYAVEGAWQGRVRRLRVIGDKKGGGTASMLARQPALLDELRRVVALPIRVVHVVRNPFDNIATIVRVGSNGPLPQAIAYYEGLCRTNGWARTQLGPGELHELRTEDFVTDPRSHLQGMAAFLGVEPEAQWLDAASAVVFASPKRTRDAIEWPPELRAKVEELIASTDFLAGYSFDD